MVAATAVAKGIFLAKSRRKVKMFLWNAAGRAPTFWKLIMRTRCPWINLQKVKSLGLLLLFNVLWFFLSSFRFMENAVETIGNWEGKPFKFFFKSCLIYQIHLTLPHPSRHFLDISFLISISQICAHITHSPKLRLFQASLYRHPL